MKTNKLLIKMSFIITLISCIAIFTANNFYQSIFIGIFTGGITSLTTSSCLYVSAKQTYLNNLYKTITGILLKLYAAQDVFKAIKTQPENTNINLQALGTLIDKAYRDGLSISLQEYSPLIGFLSYYIPSIARIYLILNKDLRDIKNSINSAEIHYYQNQIRTFNNLFSKNESELISITQQLTNYMDRLYHLGAFDEDWNTFKSFFKKNNSKIDDR